jgi:glutamate-1-semialdehyde aminotransferase
MMNRITDFSKSDEYRSRIHDLIPGGGHTYSKGDDQFPLRSPAAIEKGKGSHVWDLDGNCYLDCSMGLTSVSLGHAYEPVVNRVKEELEKGVNFQRPAAIEMEMAEKFLSLVPQHDMIKFGKNGSLVITAAVKLARAYTKRKLVAFPYDHPFYSYDDWFIGKTASDAGVPEENKLLSVTFKSCDLDSLRKVFEENPGQIACVISEPERSPCYMGNCSMEAGEFLDKAIALCHEHGALFIQDEMITGFKSAFPGSISKFNSKPDMATWGKGIANGFSFCALTGTKEVMELGGIRNKGADKVFLISTTHGGETSAIAAGLATIEEFQQNDVIGHNHRIGDYLIAETNRLIASAGLEASIELAPCNWMITFTFRDGKGEASQGMRTLMMQEMISRGVLFQGAFVPCFSHTKNDVDFFLECFKDSLSIYKQALEKGYESFLVGEPAKPVFRKSI